MNNDIRPQDELHPGEEDYYNRERLKEPYYNREKLRDDRQQPFYRRHIWQLLTGFLAVVVVLLLFNTLRTLGPQLQPQVSPTAVPPTPTQAVTPAFPTPTIAPTQPPTPAPTPVPPTPTVAPAPAPLTSRQYTGTCHNTTHDVRSTIAISFTSVTQNQNGGFAVNGYFTVDPPLYGSGPFTGTTTNQNIQFTVVAQDGGTLTWTGTINADGSINGSYTTSVGQEGTWHVTPTS